MHLRRHRSLRRMSTLHHVNVTNLVDVTMVLLIIFILITPLIQEGFNLSLPKTRAAEPLEERDAILVALTKDDKVLVNGRRVTFEEVADQVLAEHRVDRRKPVLIKSDESLTYGKVMSVIDAVRAAGIENVGLVSENESELDSNR